MREHTYVQYELGNFRNLIQKKLENAVNSAALVKIPLVID